jgi:hypothetical protein
MADFSDATDELMDSDTYMDGGMVLAGLAAGVVTKNGLDNRLPMDVPDPVYGILVAAIAFYAGYDMAAIGGIGYTGIKGAERLGIKSTVEQAGA